MTTMTATSGNASRTWRERLDDAKRRYPLPDVLEASGLMLRRGGPGTFWALCPVHAYRNASLFVDLRKADRPHWYCFGCSAKGDVIEFVRLRDGLGSLGEALTRVTGAPPPPPARVQPGP